MMIPAFPGPGGLQSESESARPGPARSQDLLSLGFMSVSESSESESHRELLVMPRLIHVARALFPESRRIIGL